MCSVCKKENYGSHAPDGRCDRCAEEHGCDCGCFPSPAMQLQAEFCADEYGVAYGQDDEGGWSATFTSRFTGRETVLG